MADLVRRKLEVRLCADPLGRVSDPWADFRQVEIINIEKRFTYRHSLGKVSRFFLELEQGRLFAAACPRCAQVWLPPRPVCPHDLAITTWRELSGKGTVAAFTTCPKTPHYIWGQEPLVLAYVDLEGASTLFLHQLRNYGDPSRLKVGLLVRAVFSQEPVDHPLELFWFEPEVTGSRTSPGGRVPYSQARAGGRDGLTSEEGLL
ncbi:MAG: OB-fold domain-containing protein [Deinococcus sp.]|nr:OB-fold domain-containing protein [Deinococcus sp.]